MGQVLRITFNGQDYSYQIVNSGRVSRETQEIQVLLDGVTYTLTREEGQWVPGEEEETAPAGLLIAISRALSLRYRI